MYSIVGRNSQTLKQRSEMEGINNLETEVKPRKLNQNKEETVPDVNITNNNISLFQDTIFLLYLY